MRILSSMLIIVIMAMGVFAGDKAKLNEAAPDFKLTDSNGKSHTLSDFKGKWVVLEWVNFDCPFVRKHYDSGNMQNLQKAYMEKGVVWLSICSSADGKQGFFAGDELTDKIKEENVASAAYLIDADGTVGKKYGAKTTPHMFIIDPKGQLVYAGGIDDKRSTDVDDVKSAKNYVSMALDAGMAGKEIPVQSSKSYGCSVKYK
jgi:peroxiredoxin